jgi:hypothetical protein
MNVRGQRIHEAQRAGLKNRVRDHWHVPEERADGLIDAWDREAMQRSLPHGHPNYWSAAEAWIQEQLEPRSSQPKARNRATGGR